MDVHVTVDMDMDIHGKPANIAQNTMTECNTCRPILLICESVQDRWRKPAQFV